MKDLEINTLEETPMKEVFEKSMPVAKKPNEGLGRQCP